MEATLLISQGSCVSASLCPFLLPLSDHRLSHLLTLLMAHDGHQPRACMALRLLFPSQLPSILVS